MKKMMMVIVMLLAASTVMAQGNKVRNSSWDGSVRQVKVWYQDHLKDPDSVQYIKWYKVVQMPNGSYAVAVRYRARNSFGGYVINHDLCVMDVLGRVIGCADFDAVTKGLRK